MTAQVDGADAKRAGQCRIAELQPPGRIAVLLARQ
jgi:hypothetical protein